MLQQEFASITGKDACIATHYKLPTDQKLNESTSGLLAEQTNPFSNPRAVNVSKIMSTAEVAIRLDEEATVAVVLEDPGGRATGTQLANSCVSRTPGGTPQKTR